MTAKEFEPTLKQFGDMISCRNIEWRYDGIVVGQKKQTVVAAYKGNPYVKGKWPTVLSLVDENDRLIHAPDYKVFIQSGKVEDRCSDCRKRMTKVMKEVAANGKHVCLVGAKTPRNRPSRRERKRIQVEN